MRFNLNHHTEAFLFKVWAWTIDQGDKLNARNMRMLKIRQSRNIARGCDWKLGIWPQDSMFAYFGIFLHIALQGKMKQIEAVDLGVYHGIST